MNKYRVIKPFWFNGAIQAVNSIVSGAPTDPRIKAGIRFEQIEPHSEEAAPEAAKTLEPSSNQEVKESLDTLTNELMKLPRAELLIKIDKLNSGGAKIEKPGIAITKDRIVRSIAEVMLANKS